MKKIVKIEKYSDLLGLGGIYECIGKPQNYVYVNGTNFTGSLPYETLELFIQIIPSLDLFSIVDTRGKFEGGAANHYELVVTPNELALAWI